jgi:hypothetical protein
MPALIAMRQWGEKYGLGSPGNTVLVDIRDRKPLARMAVFAHDGRELSWDDVEWVERDAAN